MIKGDVIVVLGAAVWLGGIPSPSLRRRVIHAVDLLHEGAAPRLLLTGGIGRNPPSEASVMRKVAIDAGVSDAQIVLEEEAKNTLESATRCAEIMHRMQWHQAIVVTDRYHILRAVVTFRLLGIEARASAPRVGRSDTARWRWIWLYFREGLALPWYALRLAMLKGRRTA
jgi:vancomycin permeability regulator SanA